MSENHIYFDVHWDIDKYRNNFDEEYWPLCREFMTTHKSKYPEARLLELTDAFYNIGIHRQSYDAKTTRIVSMLAFEISQEMVAKEILGGDMEDDIEDLIYEPDTNSQQEEIAEDSAETTEETSFENSIQSGHSTISEALHLMQQDDLEEFLKGFIIVCGVTKKSILKNQLESLNESFLLSRFKTRTWNAEKCSINNSHVRVSLLVKNRLLAQCVGKDEVSVQKQIAQALLKRISEFSPTIQANWSYYRDGVLPSLPNASSASVFRIINDTSAADNSKILKLIDDFAELPSIFKEVVFMKVGEFQKKLIMQHVDGKWNSKLTYRLATVNKPGDTTEIVFVYHIHPSEALLKWLGLGGNTGHNEQYSLIPPTNPEFAEKIKNIKVEKDSETSTPSATPRLDKSIFDPANKIKIEREVAINDRTKQRSSNIQEKSRERPEIALKIKESATDKKTSSSNSSHSDEKLKTSDEVDSVVVKECDDSELRSLLRGIIMFYDIDRHSITDKCSSVTSLSKFFEKYSIGPLEVESHARLGLWVCQIKWKNKILAIEGHRDAATASNWAALRLRSRIESFAYTIEINDSYLCQGKVPSFILHPNPLRANIYRLVYREDLMDSESIKNTINEFCNESTFAELIFGPDFSWEVKNEIVSYVESCQMEYRFFSSNQQNPSHLAVYHPVNLAKLKDHLLQIGGQNQKYKLKPPSELQNKVKKDNEIPSTSEKDNTSLDSNPNRKRTKTCDSDDIYVGKAKELPKQYRMKSPDASKNLRKYSVEREIQSEKAADTKRSRTRHSHENISSPIDKKDSWRSTRYYRSDKQSKSPERKEERRPYRKYSKEQSKSPERIDKYRSRRRYSEERENKSLERRDKNRSRRQNSEERENKSPERRDKKRSRRQNSEENKAESPERLDKHRSRRRSSEERENKSPERRDKKRSRTQNSDENETESPERIDKYRSRRKYSEEREQKSPERRDKKRSRRQNSEENETKSPERIDRKKTRQNSEENEIQSSENKNKRAENKSDDPPELIIWIGIKENSTLNRNLHNILEKSLLLANDSLSVRRSQRIEKGIKLIDCNLKSNRRELCQGTHELMSSAKALAVIATIKMLRKECYTIQPLESYYKKGSALPPAESKSEFEILSRHKFYSINSFISYIIDGVREHPSKEFIFGSDFNKLEWKVIKRQCKPFSINFREIHVEEGQGSSRKEKSEQSYLAVWKDFSPQELKRQLMSRGNKNDKYILIPPTGKITLPGSDVDLWPETLEEEVVNPPPPTSRAITKDKNTEEHTGHFWRTRKAFTHYADALVMCKLVKQDSSTESDPTSLLKSTCSVVYDVEFVYTTFSSSRNNNMVKVVLTLKCGDVHVLLGEGISLGQESAANIAARQAVHTIQSQCRVIEPNPEYFAEGNVPLFIALKKVIKTSTYEIVSMENMLKVPLGKNLIEQILTMFKKSEVEDLFFLVTDFSHDERTLVIKIADNFKLGWRLFGPRAPTTKAGDVVSSQHVCVFKPRSPLEILKQVIAKAGATDKYLMYKNGQRITTNPEELQDSNGDSSKKDFQVISAVKDDHTCLNDCPKFYSSKCPKGNECPLRHEPNAKSSLIVCALWRKGKCYDKKCIKRHMEVNTLLESSAWKDEPEEEDETVKTSETPKPIPSIVNSMSSRRPHQNVKVAPQSESTSNIVVSKGTVSQQSSSVAASKPNPLSPLHKSRPPSLIDRAPPVVAPNVQFAQPSHFAVTQSAQSLLQMPNVLPPPVLNHPPQIVSTPTHNLSPHGFQQFPTSKNPVLIPVQPEQDPPDKDLPKAVKDHFALHNILPIYNNPPPKSKNNNSSPFSDKNPSSLFKQFLDSKDKPVRKNVTTNSTVSLHKPFVFQKPNKSDVTESDERCPYEGKLGGCRDKFCKYFHLNIIDVIVNRYLQR